MHINDVYSTTGAISLPRSIQKEGEGASNLLKIFMLKNMYGSFG